PAVVVSRRQPRNHPPPKPPGSQNNLATRNGDEEVRDRYLAIDRSPGASQIRNLVVAKNRPEQDVPQAPLRQMNDLGKDRIRVQRFFRPQMLLDEAVEIRIGVAKPSEQARSRRPITSGPENTKFPFRKSIVIGRRNRHRDREGAGQRRRVLTDETLEVRFYEDDLGVTAR